MPPTRIPMHEQVFPEVGTIQKIRFRRLSSDAEARAAIAAALYWTGFDPISNQDFYAAK